MEIRITEKGFSFEKDLNHLDQFVIDFTTLLNSLGLRYTIVSGYVSILFGRSRSSEDIDLIIEQLDEESFRRLWEALLEGFECLNSHQLGEAYSDYITKRTAIRFSRKNEFIPNMEMKFPQNDLDRWTLDNGKEVVLNGRRFAISPLELQIPFKLHLGSPKDIEDAKHLYELFKDRLDTGLMATFLRKLKVEKEFTRFLAHAA